MLTDGQIRELIEARKITIAPYDEKYLRAGKYEVHLGRTLLVPENTKLRLDPRNLGIQPEYRKEEISSDGFVLKPGVFVLGQTQEIIGLDDDVGMLIDGFTTLARLGITIHQSATFIPPGQDPHIITLEIYNAGPWEVVLSLGMRVGQLIVFKFGERNLVAAKSYNPYNGQQETTGAKFE